MVVYTLHRLIDETNRAQFKSVQDALLELNRAPLLLIAFQTHQQYLTNNGYGADPLWMTCRAGRTYTWLSWEDLTGPRLKFFYRWAVAVKVDLSCHQMADIMSGRPLYNGPVKGSSIYFFHAPAQGDSELLASATLASLKL